MAKKKDAEAAAETTAEEAVTPGEKMTQREAVEKALAAGKELPADGVPYVLKEFSITLSNQAFSTIKSKIRNGVSSTTKKPGRPPASAKAVMAVAPVPSSKGPAGLAIQVEAIKSLVDTLGVDQVVSIAKLFAK